MTLSTTSHGGMLMLSSLRRAQIVRLNSAALPRAPLFGRTVATISLFLLVPKIILYRQLWGRRRCRSLFITSTAFPEESARVESRQASIPDIKPSIDSPPRRHASP
mmetsp:Transcript_15302/g.24888  ORF Transcript_15302/g.24888 Transcript_15302/m.24888 type:complete len:106 (-) Transcript_15302:862-1179(-)